MEIANNCGYISPKELRRVSHVISEESTRNSFPFQVSSHNVLSELCLDVSHYS